MVMKVAPLPNPLNILLIEDEDRYVFSMSDAITSAIPGNIIIANATTLNHALKLLAGQYFDIALLDQSLPDAAGFLPLYSIQNMAPNLPIIFLTELQDETIAMLAVQNGAQDYLLKNRSDAHLIKRVIHFGILRKEFESILITRANYDLLTGLANRVLFESRLDLALARIKRHKGYIGVLFLDLDRFKAVNDRLGHAVGDKLLRAVGLRIKQLLRADDMPARFGGDEFVILLEGIADMMDIDVVAQKIINRIKQPFTIEGQTLTIGVSIGAVACSAFDKAQVSSLIQQADNAMYEAKNQGGNRFKNLSLSECNDSAERRVR